MRHIFTIFALVLMIFASAPAQARNHFGIGIGFGCCGGYYPGYYPGYYSGYYPDYYAPPSVVYAVPPAPPPVVYMAPPQQTFYYSAPPQSEPSAPVGASTPTMTIDTSSTTYTDNSGRTCRQYQSGTQKGMACLQDDGAWHVVP